MLITLNNKEADYIPCSFMIFTALKKRCKNQFEFIEKQIELGLDTKVELPELPIRFHPEVKIKEWKERAKEGTLLYKEYHTPEGELESIIKKTNDWPYNDSIPLFNDYLVPRSKKFLMTCEEDLNSIPYLFSEPTKGDILNFRTKAKRLKKLARNRDLFVSGGWRSGGSEMGINEDAGTMGADALMWLCGAERMLLWAMDKPETIEQLLKIISHWNIKRMKIYLEEGVDLLVRRAWYESTDLWSPSLYRRFIFPMLRKEVDLTHQAGAKFGYIMTSGVMPLLDDLLKLGVDVLIGVDPIQGKKTDLKVIKEKLRGKICLWGGVNGFLTIERGTKEEVEGAVSKAVSLLGPRGGFILSPVDNVTDTRDKTWDNVKVMIETWRKLRFYK